MPPALRVIESVSHDPWFNLALEEWLFENTTPDEMVFYLWRNGPFDFTRLAAFDVAP